MARFFPRSREPPPLQPVMHVFITSSFEYFPVVRSSFMLINCYTAGHTGSFVPVKHRRSHAYPAASYLLALLVAPASSAPASASGSLPG